MATANGVDYAWSHPGGKALKAAGKVFACRYLSGDPSKNLTRAEALDLEAHGVSSVVVWETTAKRPLAGRTAGVSDAKKAHAQAVAAGMPASRPIYFAVDFDATEAQQGDINAYLDGAASVLGRARVGVYGGYYVVKRCLDGGHAVWAWQTIAWSGGHWDTRAKIRQGTQKTINGVGCDLNTAVLPDYGQWTPGEVPTTEEDMPLTAAEIEKVAERSALLTATYKNPTLDVDPKTKKGTDLRQRLVNAEKNSLAAKTQADAIAKTVAEIKTAVAAVGSVEIDYAKLALALINAARGE